MLLTLLLSFSLCQLSGQQAPYLQYLDHPRVDSVLATLSADEKIAQSVWIAIGSDEEISQYANLDYIISQHGVGGLIGRQGKPTWHERWPKYFRYRSVLQMPQYSPKQDMSAKMWKVYLRAYCKLRTIMSKRPNAVLSLSMK